MKESRAGFTLIELLVVIAILSLLIVTFAPDILGARADAQKAADKANLRWHFQQILRYQQQHKTYPRGYGHQFVLDPWVRGVVERTQSNFQRYWTPGLKENEPRIQELEDIGLDNIWKSQDELQSIDTHYAGPSEETRKSRKRLDSGKQPLMANDNEFGAAFKDQTINVLMGGDGNVIDILLEDLRELGYDGDGVEEWFPVNPSSPHPMLQQLDK